MNGVLSRDFLIPFDRISADDVGSGIRDALARAQEELDSIIAFAGERNYDNTVAALDAMQERLGRSVTIGGHLMSVMNSPELRKNYNEVLPEFSAFYAKLGLNDELWAVVKAYAATDEAKKLSPIRKRRLERLVHDFVRAGADLEPDKKARVEELTVTLSQRHTKFSENVLDATNAFELVLTDEADVSGLPESALAQARASAESKGQEGYRFTLQAPSYVPFMQYGDKRELREKLYRAYVNRASEGELDNRPLILEILKLRRELAQILGFKDFAEYRLEKNMVKNGAAALNFVRNLTEKTKPYARKENEELQAFAKRELGLERLEPWDTAYVAEKLRREKYDFDAEALRPYFPVDKVLAGMFEITGRLFGIKVTEREIAELWHPEVKFYDIHDESGTHLGSFYADWFPRESKRAGAWMNSFITGKPTSDGFEPHLGLMVGNFSPPQAGKPALLTHNEVQTTFHEFGHLLHHCLSRVEESSLAGTNVPRDFVELPSQILENWTWEREALDLFARHIDTGETIPEDLFDKMIAAKNFMAARAQMRQLSFGTVDLELHIPYNPESDGDVIAYAQKVMEPFDMRPDFANNNFLTGFSHVFTGGYAAGYYSYKWSEVLDADAFTRFQKEGIFNRKTGQAYLDTILSRGDSADADVLFREFMGRDPDLNALLKRNLEGNPTLATSGD